MSNSPTMWVSMVRSRSRLAASSGWVRTSSSSCLVMVAIRMTLSRGGIGVGAVCVGWSSALLVVVLMGSSVGWNGDSGCAPVVLFAQLSVPAHRSGPQWWRCDIGCSGVGGSVGDGDLDAADRGTVNRCRPVWAMGWWCGGVDGCAVVVGAARGVAQHGVGGQQLPQVVVGGLRRQ